jgi:hypothetical protein
LTNNRYSIGLIIVAVGIILLLGKLGVFGFVWQLFWPVLILGAGLLLHALYFNRTLPSGILILAGILITISVLFLLCTLFGWGLMKYLWPGFLFAVAVGLYEYYVFDKHSPRETFFVAVGLTIVSGVLFGMTILSTVGITFIALILIAVGAYMMFNKRRSW